VDFGLIVGELRTEVEWECFPNNTKICTTGIEDCTTCDGQLSGSSLTKREEPKTQAGRMFRSPRRRRFRFKREVSARRRSPMFGRGEIEASDKIIKEAKDGKESVDTGKKEADAGKVIRILGGPVPSNKPFTCNDVCLEKDGKYSKGKFTYSSFKFCEGVGKTGEGKEKKEQTIDESKQNKDEEPAKHIITREKDNKNTIKEEKDKKKKAKRRRRMRRNRF